MPALAGPSPVLPQMLGCEQRAHMGPWRGLGPREAGIPTQPQAGLDHPPGPTRLGHSPGEEENSGSLETNSSHQPETLPFPTRPGTDVGPTFLQKASHSFCCGVQAASYLWGEVLGHNFLPFFSQFFIWSNFIFCLKQKKEKNNNRFARVFYS